MRYSVAESTVASAAVRPAPPIVSTMRIRGTLLHLCEGTGDVIMPPEAVPRLLFIFRAGYDRRVALSDYEPLVGYLKV